ncbi:aminomethyl-transferring glycine dehydrogenase subunit GcvPA [Aeoliella sp. SH292]|uniref:aminomethyl-transferring glycine dehydrogenase subunit GcvPA n=1 Tax=Aeoliella sp. SH292 TaxID=3454464 RepID=UPI003F9AB8D1
MPYIYNTPDDQAEMLSAIGASSIEELFAPIPSDLRLKRPLDIPPALGELALEQHVRELGGRNMHASNSVCFLGGGSYDHFVPAAVDTIAGRSEFYTSYTPYQAEVSQGNLQAMFEYQSMITRLTGLAVSNSSLYDGGSSVAEAVLMAVDVTKRMGRVVVPASVHPEYRQVIATYLANLGVEVVTVGTPDGVVDVAELAAEVNDQTSCVVVQTPNFFGCLEDAEAIAKVAHDAGALCIGVFDPISLGLLKRPGDWGADIAVAEGQSLGTAMSYGGPVLGILACKEELIRRLPGRVVGLTTDRRGNPCYTLTMQTREQHIRREKSTSNVCTNQALFALRATVYLTLVGPEGLRDVANLCLQKSRYLAEKLDATSRFEVVFSAPTFKEFVVRDKENAVEALVADAAKEGYLAGIPLGRWYPDLADCMLVCVTEKRTKAQMDALVEVLQTGAAKAAADELIQAGI